MKRVDRECDCPACAQVATGIEGPLKLAAYRSIFAPTGMIVDDPMQLAEAICWARAHGVPFTFGGLFPADQKLPGQGLFLLVAATETPPWVGPILEGLQETWDDDGPED